MAYHLTNAVLSSDTQTIEMGVGKLDSFRALR